MREYINTPVLVNLVSMIRSETVGAILLVDHESEGRFYESLVHKSARVIPSSAMAIEIFISATQRGIAGLAVALRNTRVATGFSSHQFTPSIGDTSSLLICSSNFERAITNATGRTWYSACEKEIGSLAIRCTALACALERITKATTFSLDEEAASKLIDWSKLELLGDLISNTTSPEYNKEVQTQFIEDQKKSLRELLCNCDGDLAISVIASAIERYQPHGLRPDSTLSSIDLSKTLELSYPLENIEEDPVFWKMRKWERSNSRYKLLQQWRTLDSFKLVWDQRYWEPDLKSILGQGESNSGLSLIKLDLDNFKSVNTHLGHGGGDEAIKIASQIISSNALGVGEVYRRGGDEFIIIAPDLRGSEAEQLSERIRSEIELAFLAWGKIKKLEIFPTASIGIVDADYGIEFEALTQAVDQAQQTAKDNGKNMSIYKRLVINGD